MNKIFEVKAKIATDVVTVISDIKQLQDDIDLNYSPEVIKDVEPYIRELETAFTHFLADFKEKDRSFWKTTRQQMLWFMFGVIVTNICFWIFVK